MSAWPSRSVPMSRKSAIFLTSALVSAGLIGNPIAAEAGALSHSGTPGGNAALSAALSCGAHPGPVGAPFGNVGGGGRIFAPVSVNNQAVNQNINVIAPSGINSNVQNFNVQNNGGVVVNKPINVQTNI